MEIFTIRVGADSSNDDDNDYIVANQLGMARTVWALS